MRIGLNLLYLIPGVVGGTQTYAQSLMMELARVDGNNEYLIYANRESWVLGFPEARNFRTVRCSLRASRRLARYAWEQCVLPRMLGRDAIDVVLSPGYVCPLFTPCANVVTICDMNYVAMRDVMHWGRRLLLSAAVRQSAKRADRILTLSEFSKREIVKHLAVSPSKVTVTYLASRLREHEPDRSGNTVQARYGIHRPYVLAFTSPSPHKNTRRLIEAFARIAGEVSHTLVLVGRASEECDVSQAPAGRVVTTGYVSDEVILPLMADADLFVCPSWYEGFGLPVADAQSLGVPVACSAVASLPEVGGRAAAYFDPWTVSDMADTMRRCLKDQGLAARLSSEGRKHAAGFTWAATAAKTLAVLKEAVADRAHRKQRTAPTRRGAT
jgi:glycosyltransferase involved in cell wall biosynthesis